MKQVIGVKHYIKTQKGRSMVEMLGVLAVVGVLSVAALAGYNLAMNRHWANELLDEANKRSISAMTQIDNGGNVTLGDFTDNVFRGGAFDTTVQVWEGEFGIRVSNVPEAVCQNLTKMTAGTISVAKVSEENGKDDISAENCESENDLYLVYKITEAEECNEVCNKAGSDCRCNTTTAPSACAKDGKICITCAAGETPKCADNGTGTNDCVCQKANEKAACSSNKCITCAADETPKCSSDGYGTDACVCQKANESVACSTYRCITCAADETATCSRYGSGTDACVCKKANESAGCGGYSCITCAADETTTCSTGGSGTYACVCRKANETAACGVRACITCAADETPKCSTAGTGTDACVCRKANESAACASYRCITCSSGTAQCNNGTCQCVQ